jgi:archaetidylinositol phosphate synthase
LSPRFIFSNLFAQQTAGSGLTAVPANRVNDSALGVFERPVLAWIAERLPSWIAPDHLTVIGLAGAVAAAAGYIGSRWSLQWLWIASAGLVVNWVGDSLDGTIARLRKVERPRYGFFVDHTSDLFGQALLFLALGVSPCAHFQVACLGLIAFLMAFVYSLICAEVRDTMRITYFGFGPTEIRVLLIAGNLITLRAGVLDIGQSILPRGWFGPVTLYELVIVIVFAMAVPALAILTLQERARLAKEDPRRPVTADRSQ